jgi:hypothetical protein
VKATRLSQKVHVNATKANPHLEGQWPAAIEEWEAVLRRGDPGGQVFNAAAGLVPHPEELPLDEVTNPEWTELEEDEVLFRRGYATYPVLPLEE